MKCQAGTLGKCKKNITDLSSATFAKRVLKPKYAIVCLQISTTVDLLFRDQIT